MGKHTLMSAIPSKWIQRHNLKQGDLLEFTESDNKLILNSNSEIYEKKIEITITSPTKMVVWRTIQPTYTSGYDEVKINFKDKNTIKIIENSISNLIGFEIVEIGSNYLKVKSVSNQLDEEFNTILRRSFFILKNMFETTKDAFENNDKSKFEEIKTLELSINRYTMFLKRVINRRGYKYPHYMYLVVSFLDLTGNHLEYIRRYYKRNIKVKIASNILKEFSKLEDLNNKIYNLYYNFKREDFNWIAEELPHFKWFRNIKDPELKFNFIIIAEYLVQISRQIQAMNISA